jgi:transposase
MPAPYSVDLRLRCMEALRRGEKELEVANWGGISTRTLRNWKRREKEEGHVKPITDFRPGPKPRIDPEKLKAHVASYPDMILEERGKQLGCSRTTMFRSLASIGYTRKKRLFFTTKEMKSNVLNLKKS